MIIDGWNDPGESLPKDGGIVWVYTGAFGKETAKYTAPNFNEIVGDVQRDVECWLSLPPGVVCIYSLATLP